MEYAICKQSVFLDIEKNGLKNEEKNFDMHQLINVCKNTKTINENLYSTFIDLFYFVFLFYVPYFSKVRGDNRRVP